MEIFKFIPSIFTGIISIALFYNSEKEEDYVNKIWGFIIASILVWFTIFLFKETIEYDNDFNGTNKTEYIYDYMNNNILE